MVAKSPEYESQKQRAQDLFTAAENIRASILQLSNVRMTNNTAAVRVRYEMKLIISSSKEPVQDTSLWQIQLVKEGADWRLSSKRTFAELLVDLSKEERHRLLKEEVSLVTKELVDSIGELAEEKAKKGESQKAFEINAVAFDVAELSNSKSALGSYYQSRGEIFRILTDNKEALEAMQRALELFKEAGDKGAEINTRNSISVVYSITGRNEEALKQLTEIREIYRQSGKKLEEEIVLTNIAVAYSSMGRHEEAQKAYEEVLGIARMPSVADTEGVAIALNGIATQLSKKGYFEEALSKFRESFDFARASKIPSEEASALQNMAHIYQLRGQFSEALEKIDACLKVYQKHPDKAGEASARGIVGGIYARTGRYAEALRIFTDILDLFHEAEMKQEEATIRSYRASVYWATGRYEDALQDLSISIDLVRATKDTSLEAAHLNNIGIVYLSMRDYEEALRVLQKALDLSEGLDSKALALNNIGEAYQEYGKYTEALEAYEKSLRIKREIGNKLGEAATLTNIGAVYSTTGKYEDALNKLDEALRIATPLDDTYSTFPIYINIGDVYYAQKLWSQAATAYENAIKRIEKIRIQTEEKSLQTGFFKQYTKPYHLRAESLLELGDKKQAFSVSEQAKARTLINLLQGGKVNVRKAMTVNERKQERVLSDTVLRVTGQLNEARRGGDKSRISRLESELRIALSDLEKYNLTMFFRHPELTIQRAEFKPVELDELGRRLSSGKSNWCLLAYVIGEGKVFLYAVRAGKDPGTPVDVQVNRLKNDSGQYLSEEEITEKVRNFRLRCSNENGIYKSLSQELHRLLIAPAENMIADADHLLIIPDGILNLLPFHALTDGVGSFLVQKRRISYAPSATALVEMMKLADRRRKRGGKRSLFFTGSRVFPDHEEFRARELPWAEKQVNQIARLYKVRPTLGARATEARARTEMRKARYIHIATHGVLNEAAPMYSAVLLRKDLRNDGWLYASELVDMDLEADLITLSSCDTGLGQQVNGEGILGLTWALFVAGTPSSVVTQWSVRDDSMNKLMVEFYKQLKSAEASGKRISKAEALRQVQLSLLDDDEYKHPYHWAPAVLVGDWR